MSHYKSTRELKAMDLVNLNLDQMMRTTPELRERHHPLSPNKHQSNGRTLRLKRFYVHRLPLHGGSTVASTLGPATLQSVVRKYYHWATVVTGGYGVL
ncbi:hypothetical protein TNCV_2890191 [Trichonephila clavipes]|nr:hypothetical protein TNCV_2890191 [Trichonephila clavipes]